MRFVTIVGTLAFLLSLLTPFAFSVRVKVNIDVDDSSSHSPPSSDARSYRRPFVYPPHHKISPHIDYESEYGLTFDRMQDILNDGNAQWVVFNDSDSHSSTFASAALSSDATSSSAIVTSGSAFSLVQMFHVFCQRFHRDYVSVTEQLQHQNSFINNVKKILSFNQRHKDCTLGTTDSADQTEAEFLQFNTGLILPSDLVDRTQNRWWDGAYYSHGPTDGYEGLGLVPAVKGRPIILGGGATQNTDPDNPQCAALQGTCMQTTACTTGNLVSDKCNGPSNIKCCVPKTSGGGSGSPAVVPAWLNSQVVDWVAKGMVSPIRNQGSCPACYSFSAIATLESNLAIASGKAVQQFSDQAGVDCTTGAPYNNIQCNGGWYGSVWDWMLAIEDKSSHSEAVPFLSSYPYTGENEDCNANELATRTTSPAYLTGYMNILANDVASIMAAVDLGPVSASVYSACPEFRSYKSGIVTDSTGSCSTQGVDHAINIVGYGLMSDGTPYWKVRNSWGTTWGMSGYGYVLRGQNTIRIETYVSAVHVDLTA